MRHPQHHTLHFKIKSMSGVLVTWLVLLMGLSAPAQAQETDGHHHIRCNTIAVAEMWRENRAALEDGTHPFAKPQSGELNSFQSPSGRFVFWYTLEGTHAVPAADFSGSGIPDWVEMAAGAADHAWDVFVPGFGFRDAVPQGGSYEFFFQNLGYYGFTSISGGQPFSVIDSTYEWVQGNDWEDDAMGAAMVSIAHEFYHAIQFKYNQWDGPSGETAWLEMDAVNAENLAFPDVNEYLHFLGNNSIFRFPSQSTPVAYDHATWMMFFSEHVEPGFFRHVWERIEEDGETTFPDAIQLELDQRGKDMKSMLTRLHLWHLASGTWSHADYGFADAHRYPTSFKRTQRSSVPVEPYPMWSINKLAANYHAIIPAPADTGEVVIALFKDNPFTGAGLLAFHNDGSIGEIIVPLNGSPVLFRTGWRWEELDRLGVALTNIDNAQSRIHQLMAGASDGIEQIRYGDVDGDGMVEVMDAQMVLDYIVGHDFTLSFAKRFGADINGSGAMTAFDAGLIFKHGAGFLDTFPVDANGNDFGPEYADFPAPMAAVPNHQGTVIRLLEPDDTSGPEIIVPVQVDGHPDEIISIELDLVFTSEILTFGLVSFTGSNFEELIYSSTSSSDTLRVAWASNRFKSGGIMGSLVFSVEEEGFADLDIFRARVNETQDGFQFEGVSFYAEDNPPVGLNPFLEVPQKTALLPAYPNPFNPATVIPFSLSNDGAVTVSVYDVSGRKVARLADNVQYPAGVHELRFDGSGLSSGVYLVRMGVSGSPAIHTAKILLMK